MRILVTGCTGFAGGYLVEELVGRPDNSVYGVSRRPEKAGSLSDLQGKLAALLECNLADRHAIETALREVRPEAVYHLAGYAQVGRSFQEADDAWDANLTATRNLYEAVIRWGGKPRILAVGSGLVYGEARSSDGLTNESSPLRPVSPYAASKAAADLVGFQYGQSNRLEIVRARPFNHIGPRQSPEFAVAHFARQIALIEHGLQPPLLETGDLTPRRDLTDVRDMVRAYALLGEHGKSGDVYNIGTGAVHSMQAVLDRLLALARVKIEVRQAANLMRASDPAALRADATKLRQDTGWAPRYSLDQTLADILEYWRTVIVQQR
jgi:GDP-4-dehydro-6-deoxy-D-mannose reductase